MAEAQIGYKHWQDVTDPITMERGTVVVKKKVNRVHVPDALEGAKGNHVYARTIDENNQPGMAYVAQPYDREQGDYPKVLYHPKYHAEPKPLENDHKDLGSYNGAMLKWEQQFARTVHARDKEHEAELLKKGWLPSPPKAKVEKNRGTGEDI